MAFKDFFRLDVYRYNIINFLIQKYNFKKYLEIGVFEGDTFKAVKCPYKISVDPEQYGYTTHQMTSDEFFENLNEDEKFDIIFIDGLHTYEQCYKDIENSIKHLSEHGFILCHDMNPCDAYVARNTVFYDGDGFWTGNVYKAFIKFRQNHLDYSSCMLYDCDWGIGVITKGIGQFVECDVDNITFDEFANNKTYLMNCISTKDFVNTFC